MNSAFDWSIFIKNRIKGGKTENDACAPQLCQVQITEISKRITSNYRDFFQPSEFELEKEPKQMVKIGIVEIFWQDR